MDSHALEYFRQYSGKSEKGHFHHVLSLHDNSQKSWEELNKMAPSLCRGWYELSHLSTEDRIGFTREFWLAKLPYQPNLNEALDKFFSSLDDIAIFLTQKTFGDIYEPHLVYSLAQNGGFFHGRPPMTDKELAQLKQDFVDLILPGDYLAFLQIHNGFCKVSDTGILPSFEVKRAYEQLQKLASENEKDPLLTSRGKSVDPTQLIPFYESFGMPFFQCFWKEWYPEQEMGNVYYSGLANTISVFSELESSEESMAFKTFADWLLFYIEKVD